MCYWMPDFIDYEPAAATADGPPAAGHVLASSEDGSLADDTGGHLTEARPASFSDVHTVVVFAGLWLPGIRQELVLEFHPDRALGLIPCIDACQWCHFDSMLCRAHFSSRRGLVELQPTLGPDTP